MNTETLMRHVLRKSACLIALFAVASRIPAQTRGGSSGGGQTLSDRVDLSYEQAYVETPSTGRTDWMRYVILWRGQSGWHSPRMSQAEARESQQAFRAAQATAMLNDRSLLGGSAGSVNYWAEIDHEHKAVIVLGNTYAIPERDSTLVLLVDRVDGVGGQSVVLAAAVVDGRLSTQKEKSWVSGDTTFIVRPHTQSGLDEFLERLKKDPLVAAFLQ
jgi:hypothetical protein